MTFDLTADQLALRDRARTFARDHLLNLADEIDRTASVPDVIAQQAAEIVASAGDATGLVTAVEELAAASGAVAATAAGKPPIRTATTALPGLRGASVLDDHPRSQLTVAAVALGLGRAALEAALSELRHATAIPAGPVEKPHWVVADAATALEASRMATRAAAQAVDRGDGRTEVAIARLLTESAAAGAVDAAVRIAGSAGYREGTLLERLARDVRTLSLVLGTQEQHRAVAADGLLPE